MKKIIVLMFAAIMCMSALAGCGEKKSDMDQASEEIRQHLSDDAAADDVDLQAMFEQEAADSMARTSSREQEREEKQSLRNELDTYYDPLLQEEFDALIAAATAEETIEHGDRYNELIAERNSKGNDAGISWGNKSCYVELDPSYIAKALFITASQNGSFDNWNIYHTGTFFGKNSILAVCFNNNEFGNPDEYLFVHEDLSVCKLDPGEYFAEDTPLEFGSVSSSYIEIVAIENADWNKYLYDITEAEAVLIDKSTDYENDGEYNSKVNTLVTNENTMGFSWDYLPGSASTDDLNKMIINNALGMEASSYR